jgi:myo-inositol-1(or 4)-monophosphatase
VSTAGAVTPQRAELARELAVARAAADASATILRQRFLRPARRTRKGRHDVVTDVDRAAERAIMGRIHEAFPADSRVGEETGTVVGGDAGRTWLVDPLDGTINYVSGIPWFSVSIALVVNGEVVVGVVTDPLRHERFVAAAGTGAWHEPSGGRLRIRRIARVGDAVVAGDAGDPGDDGADTRIARLRSQVRVVRTLGSTALSLAYLAAGRLDGVFQVNGLQAVDIAAGACIASLAGARVTASDGGRWLGPDRATAGGGIAAGGRAVHALLVATHRAERVDSQPRPPVASGT